MHALVGGKVNFVTSGPQIVEANLAGSDTVYVMSPVNTFVFSVYGKPEIVNIRALAGKTLGATNKGTPTDVAGHMLFRQNGLKPEVDAKFAYLKEIPWSPRCSKALSMRRCLRRRAHSLREISL